MFVVNLDKHGEINAIGIEERKTGQKRKIKSTNKKYIAC